MISRFAKSFVLVIAALLLISTFTFFHSPTRSYLDPLTGDLFGEGGVETHLLRPQKEFNNISHGSVIMPKLGNATAKAALGRATWKLLHTVTLRYPEKPTPEEREALNAYFHLTSRMYPCGECAAEFQLLLKQFPPQTSSRRAAATWLCNVHNQVNRRLEKLEFDCANLDSEYDCGCGDDKNGDIPSETKTNDPMDLEQDSTKDEFTGARLIPGRV